MADKKISELQELDVELEGTEIFPIVKNGSNYKVTVGDVAELVDISPAGSDTQIQFNDDGSFGGDAGLTYNKATDTLNAGITNSGSFRLSPSGIVTDSGTTRNLSATDNGKIIYFTANSPIQLNTSTGLGAGFSCAILQGGSGIVTVSQSGGTTLASFGSLYKTSGQYAIATIICPENNVFYLSGQLS